MAKAERKQITVYTIGYFPFTMGGSVERPIKCDMEGWGPYPLGGEYQGYIVVGPNGKQFVAESETGAFVGGTLAEVRADIKAGDPEIMKEQIEKAREQARTAEIVQPDQFWKLLRANI